VVVWCRCCRLLGELAFVVSFSGPCGGDDAGKESGAEAWRLGVFLH
jgi:hypothetical protein